MKKFIYYGLALIIIAIVLALVSGYLLNSKVSGSISSTNVTVNSGSFAYVAIPGGNYTALALYMIMANSTNMYVMNGSTFSKWSGYLGSNGGASGLARAQALEVDGNYIFVDKRSVYTQLFTQQSSAQNSSMNSVYVVIDNTPGSNSSKISVSGLVTYIPIKLSSLLVYEAPVILAIILAIAGLIVIIYGLVKKGAQNLGNALQPNDGKTKEQHDKEYLEQIYKGVDSDKKKRNRKGRKREEAN